MLPIIGGIIAGVVELGKTIGGGFLEKSKIKTEGKIAIKKAKIASEIKRYDHIGEMDISAMKGMQFSWKDELLTIWTIAVVTSCFIPGLQDYVRDGFVFILNDTPDWFGWCFTGMYAAVFGLRTFKGWNR